MNIHKERLPENVNAARQGESGLELHPGIPARAIRPLRSRSFDFFSRRDAVMLLDSAVRTLNRAWRVTLG